MSTAFDISQLPPILLSLHALTKQSNTPWSVYDMARSDSDKSDAASSEVETKRTVPARTYGKQIKAVTPPRKKPEKKQVSPEQVSDLDTPMGHYYWSNESDVFDANDNYSHDSHHRTLHRSQRVSNVAGGKRVAQQWPVWGKRQEQQLETALSGKSLAEDDSDDSDSDVDMGDFAPLMNPNEFEAMEAFFAHGTSTATLRSSRHSKRGINAGREEEDDNDDGDSRPKESSSSEEMSDDEDRNSEIHMANGFSVLPSDISLSNPIPLPSTSSSHHSSSAKKVGPATTNTSGMKMPAKRSKQAMEREQQELTNNLRMALEEKQKQEADRARRRAARITPSTASSGRQLPMVPPFTADLPPKSNNHLFHPNPLATLTASALNTRAPIGNNNLYIGAVPTVLTSTGGVLSAKQTVVGRPPLHVPAAATSASLKIQQAIQTSRFRRPTIVGNFSGPIGVGVVDQSGLLPARGRSPGSSSSVGASAGIPYAKSKRAEVVQKEESQGTWKWVTSPKAFSAELSNALTADTNHFQQQFMDLVAAKQRTKEQAAMNTTTHASSTAPFQSPEAAEWAARALEDPSFSTTAAEESAASQQPLFLPSAAFQEKVHRRIRQAQLEASCRDRPDFAHGFDVFDCSAQSELQASYTSVKAHEENWLENEYAMLSCAIGKSTSAVSTFHQSGSTEETSVKKMSLELNVVGRSRLPLLATKPNSLTSPAASTGSKGRNLAATAAAAAAQSQAQQPQLHQQPRSRSYSADGLRHVSPHTPLSYNGKNLQFLPPMVAMNSHAFSRSTSRASSSERRSESPTLSAGSGASSPLTGLGSRSNRRNEKMIAKVGMINLQAMAAGHVYGSTPTPTSQPRYRAASADAIQRYASVHSTNSHEKGNHLYVTPHSLDGRSSVGGGESPFQLHQARAEQDMVSLLQQYVTRQLSYHIDKATESKYDRVWKMVTNSMENHAYTLAAEFNVEQLSKTQLKTLVMEHLEAEIMKALSTSKIVSNVTAAETDSRASPSLRIAVAGLAGARPTETRALDSPAVSETCAKVAPRNFPLPAASLTPSALFLSPPTVPKANHPSAMNELKMPSIAATPTAGSVREGLVTPQARTSHHQLLQFPPSAQSQSLLQQDSVVVDMPVEQTPVRTNSKDAKQKLNCMEDTPAEDCAVAMELEAKTSNEVAQPESSKAPTAASMSMDDVEPPAAAVPAGPVRRSSKRSQASRSNSDGSQSSSSPTSASSSSGSDPSSSGTASSSGSNKENRTQALQQGRSATVGQSKKRRSREEKTVEETSPTPLITAPSADEQLLAEESPRKRTRLLSQSNGAALTIASLTNSSVTTTRRTRTGKPETLTVESNKLVRKIYSPDKQEQARVLKSNQH